MRKHQAYIEEHQQERQLAKLSIQAQQFWNGQAMHLQRLLVSGPRLAHLPHLEH